MRQPRAGILVLLAACSVNDPVAILRGDGGPFDDMEAADGGPADAASPDGGPVLGCDAVGSVLVWNETAAPFGMCVCGDLTSSGPLVLDASGAVGGTTALEDRTRVEEGLWLNGDLSGTAGADIQARELYVAGALRSDAAVRVERIVGAGGDVRAALLEANLGLSLPAGARLDVATLQASVRRAPFPGFEPCDCTAPEPSDPWAGRGVDPKDLVGNQTLPCGALRTSSLTADAPTTWTVSEPTQLWVDGDVNLDAGLVVEVAPGAGLDLIVTGTLVSSGRVTLGSVQGPVNLRVSGRGTLQLSGGAEVYGDLDAPAARLVSSAALDVQGRLRVQSLSAVGEVRVRGSSSILEAGEPCGQDGDCRAPSVCSPDGACGP
jgi:cytoskeletal protein CcmA (bactofilin family)